MADSPKTTPTGQLRDPLPAIYPVALIDTSVRLLAAMAALKTANLRAHPESLDLLDEAGAIAIRIIRDGLRSHEAAAAEGRSRG